jgi:sulfur carrier protein ThiS
VKIKVTLTRTNKKLTLDLNNGSKVEDILKQINLKPDTVIIMNDNKPVPIDEKIKDNQNYTILQVSSGG